MLQLVPTLQLPPAGFVKLTAAVKPGTAGGPAAAGKQAPRNTVRGQGKAMENDKQDKQSKIQEARGEETGAGVAIVDPGPTTSLPRLLAMLDGAGVAPGDVRRLLLTHIYLDHAGATGSLLRRNPHIEVYVSERGAPHLVDPTKLLARSAEPFIRPTEAYERTGQYAEGTTFIEGLVPFHGRWFLYYGTADSRVGVAVSESSASRRGSGG